MYAINKWIVWALTLLLIYLGFEYLSNIIAYIVLAIIVAFIGRPLVNFLSETSVFKLKLPRWVASLVTLFFFMFVLVGFTMLLSPLLSKQIKFLYSIDYDTVMNGIEEKLDDYAIVLNDLGMWPTQEEWDNLIQSAAGWISFTKIGSYFGSVISLSISALIGLFSVFFIAFYLLKDAGLLNKVIFSSTPDRHLGKMEKAVDNIKRLLSRYFSGLVLQIFIVGVVVSLGLSIIGVQNALILGVIAGIFNLIPYIGPYIGASFGVLLGVTSELAIGSQTSLLPFSLQILSVFIAVQLLDNFVLQPLIFSKSVKAHPLEIFLVVLISGTLFGILGMIAAIPVYTILRVVAMEFLPNLKVVQKLTNKLKEDSQKQDTDSVASSS
jgi:predicted PurR-regulated permease PerM